MDGEIEADSKEICTKLYWYKGSLGLQIQFETNYQYTDKTQQKFQ